MAGPPKVDWDRMSTSYDRFRGIAEEIWIQQVVEMGGLARGHRLLDVGCGTGRFAAPLRSRGISVVGLDASPAMLRQARAKEARLGLVRGLAQALPFRPGAFQTALAAYVIQHLEDLRGTLAEMARVAKSVLVLTAEIRPDSRDILYEAFPSVLSIDAKRFPSPEALAGTMEMVGLRRVEVRKANLPGRLTPSEFLEAVRSRYISTLTLISEAEFQAGLTFLERELPKRFPHRMGRHRTMVFAAGHR